MTFLIIWISIAWTFVVKECDYIANLFLIHASTSLLILNAWLETVFSHKVYRGYRSRSSRWAGLLKHVLYQQPGCRNIAPYEVSNILNFTTRRIVDSLTDHAALQITRLLDTAKVVSWVIWKCITSLLKFSIEKAYTWWKRSLIWQCEIS
jgi:hypothetical protein